MNLCNKILYYIKVFRFIFFPLYFVSFLIPRKKALWLFGSSQDRFAENAKALFLYTSKNHTPDIVSIWITGDNSLVKSLRKNNYMAYHRWSLKGIYVSLRAKYYFYNSYATDINFYTCGNATLVNLWHGIPLKQIEVDIQNGPLYKMFHTRWSYLYRFFKPYMFKKPNYVLSTSETTSKIFASAFRIDSHHCLPLGYPRNDIFFKEIAANSTAQKETVLLLTSIHKFKKENYKIIFYMPTWRSGNVSFWGQAIPDFDKLNNTLVENSSILFIKPHPNTPVVKEKYSNIIFVDPLTDIYTLLPFSDYLITDYSSIFFDYLLLDKEIIFYAFDYDEYLQEDRELYFNYYEKTPGKKVYDFEDLLQLLSNFENLDFSKKRIQIKNEFWDSQDGDASKRIYRYFTVHYR